MIKRKIESYKKIYEIFSFKGIVYKLLRKLKLIEKHDYFISERKKIIENKIINISQKKVLYGPYKDTFFSTLTNWSSDDTSSKLLGQYEMQIQEKILIEQKKYNLKNLVNFGAADGYHIVSLLKKNYFEKGFAFEIDKKSKYYLDQNIVANNLSNRLFSFYEANFDIVFKNLSKTEFNKTLFLVDIEGDEFNILNENILKKLKQSFLIIEYHDFLFKNKQLIKQFEQLIKKIFTVEYIYNSARNPHSLDVLDDFNDDDKWLIMSESRPQTHKWIYLRPKD